MPTASLKGLASYRRLLDALRMARKTAVAESELSLFAMSMDDEHPNHLRIRWQAQLWLRLPLRPLVGGRSTDEPLTVDGISLYELDAQAKVAVHRLEYLHPLPTRQPDLQLCFT